MSEQYDLLYLAPHLDDAAMSCGGQIYAATQAGQRVLVATIMAASPSQVQLSSYAQSLHERWELVADAVAARRDEDRAAAAILGADVWHGPLADCIYRLDPSSGRPYYVSDDDIFGPLAPDEAPLVVELVDVLRALPAAERIILPLTVGHHVDHQLTRLAAERLYASDHCLYYEDYPYAQAPNAVGNVLAQSPDKWAAQTIVLDEAALQAKIDAIAAYRSQISTFFADEADLAAQVTAFAAARGEQQGKHGRMAERLWQRLPVVE